MKITCISLLSLCSFTLLQASNRAYEDAHITLKNYFQNQLTAEQKIKDHRTLILTQAAQKLGKGVTRPEFREIRILLEQELTPSPENEQIIARIKTIKENHARRFPFCCKPCIFQSTITREAASLHLTINQTLKKEHAEVYNSLQTNKTAQSSNIFVTAYPVPSSLTSPLLNKSLDQFGRNI